MRLMLCLPIFALASGSELVAADLAVTDSKGEVTRLTGAYVRYGETKYFNAPTAYDDERNGLRVLQGDATVTVKWSNIKAITVKTVPPPPKYKHFESVP